MGLYRDKILLQWFLNEYAKIAKHKIDHGKSCFRFKYFDEIPYELIGGLVTKISVKDWITLYEDYRSET